MAKKKRKPKGEGPKRKKRARPAAEDLTELPDRRVMESIMQQFLTGMEGGGNRDTPEAKAQDLIYQAFGEPDPERRLALARKALEAWPDCADAYVLLAENARTRKEALGLYEQGVAAGERALGPQTFEEGAGHFWGLLETRPYMRARLGLANSLWTAGHREEAVRHLQDMLRLNPNDNQGLRYTLAGYLLDLDRDDDLTRLLDQYPEEDSAAWAYTRALLAFRREGDTPAARKLFKEARKTNKHVPTYLLGGEQLQPPGPYSPGDENEANNYAVEFIGGWKSTRGALAWLREMNRGKKKRKAERPPPKGPLSLTKNWLKKRLEQGDEVWQADFRQLPQWVESDGQRARLWLVLVINRDADLVLAHDLGEEEPSPALLWDTVVQAMQHPLAGTGHRPTELQVLGREAWTSLRPHFEEVGVQLETVPELDQWQEVYESLSEHLGGRPQPGLLDVPGVTPEQVGSFYEAAAYFYSQAPWKKVGYEAAIQVACDKFESSPWYAVLMGQGGMTLGLALYEDLNTLRRMWTRDTSDEENARETVGTSVTFGDETEIPVADLDAARQYGWKVARPEAYPCIFHKERGMSLRPPLAWELELMEGCLRAIPEFVNRHRDPESRAQETMTVPAAKGNLTLELTWVGDLEE